MFNALLQDRDMPEPVKSVLLQVQNEILQLNGFQRQALLRVLPTFAKTATSLEIEIANHNSLLLKMIKKWKNHYENVLHNLIAHSQPPKI